MKENNFSSRLSMFRQNKNMTQEELAGRMGVTPQALSKWERGHSLPDILLLKELCRILEISADDLLGIENRKRNLAQITKLFGAIGVYFRKRFGLCIFGWDISGKNCRSKKKISGRRNPNAVGTDTR